MKLTPADIEDIYRRMETGDTTIGDANALRAYHLSLRARIDEDLKEDDEPAKDLHTVEDAIWTAMVPLFRKMIVDLDRVMAEARE